MVADGGKDGERAQQRAGDLEEALPVAFVAATVDEITGEDGEVGLLLEERRLSAACTSWPERTSP